MPWRHIWPAKRANMLIRPSDLLGRERYHDKKPSKTQKLGLYRCASQHAELRHPIPKRQMYVCEPNSGRIWITHGYFSVSGVVEHICEPNLGWIRSTQGDRCPTTSEFEPDLGRIWIILRQHVPAPSVEYSRESNQSDIAEPHTPTPTLDVSRSQYNILWTRFHESEECGRWSILACDKVARRNWPATSPRGGAVRGVAEHGGGPICVADRTHRQIWEQKWNS